MKQRTHAALAVCLLAASLALTGAFKEHDFKVCCSLGDASHLLIWLLGGCPEAKRAGRVRCMFLHVIRHI